MRKNLLGTLLLMFISVAAFGQAYTYHVYQATPLNGTAYSVPDAKITGMGVFTPEAGKNTYSIGLDARNFDQVDGSGAASVFANDLNKTCGVTANPGAETALGNAPDNIRGWDFSFEEVNASTDPNLGPFIYNGNPGTFRKGGGWYMYTVNFTQAKEYALFMRVRGLNPNASNHMYTVTIYDKANMATEVAKWDFSLQGMAFGTEGSESTDAKMKFVSWAKDGATGQAGSCWISSNDKVNITAAGEYVVKVSHNDPGNANSALGAFTFVPDFATTIPSAKASIANVTFANNTLTASFGELVNGTMKIYNLSGSVVFEKAIASSSVSENINLVKGVYLVSVETNAGSVVEKIIVK